MEFVKLKGVRDGIKLVLSTAGKYEDILPEIREESDIPGSGVFL